MMSTHTEPMSARERHEQSLRAELTARDATSPFTLADATRLFVPLLQELATLHASGERAFVHGSSVLIDAAGRGHLDRHAATQAPHLAADCACLAPEEREGQPGTARGSVYSVGALLYEALTGLSVGPGMQRPSALVPGLAEDVDVLLSRALVTDAALRPDNLLALAEALHALAPDACTPLPPRPDDSDDLDVDVSLSMLPPPPEAHAARRASPASPVMLPPPKTAEEELAELKARLESDPRPRYVVVKDGCDHGPFTAVELLQQLASHTFTDEDDLSDSLSRERRPIGDWEQFAPFAEHARRGRGFAEERAVLAREARAEGTSARRKTMLALAALGAVAAAGAIWFVTARGTKADVQVLGADEGTNIETDAGVEAAKKRRRPGGGVGSAAGAGVPGGLSCEAAQEQFIDEVDMSGRAAPADITRDQYAAVMNTGSYLGGCGVGSYTIKICAAVQNGRAVGVTVRTEPADPGVASCVDHAVRRLSFPQHPKLDVVRTSFGP